MSCPATPSPLPRAALHGDCRSCDALCCTVFGFSRSADFPIDKPAGVPCTNLAPDRTCTIHTVLRPRGYRGCTVFDCFGAGQAVSTRIPAPQRAAVFPVVKQLHEMLWHLAEAQRRSFDPATADTARALTGEIAAAAATGADALRALDVESVHTRVRALLVEVSAEVRAAYRAGGDEPERVLHAGADLAGRTLRGRRLCGADLRGACLIGADLRETDLTAVDLLGADLRDARLEGADLSAALFVTAPQVAAARGDRRTRLPVDVAAPPWFG